MRTVRVTIHNFRSICDATLDLQRFSLILGPNNSGKSNLFAALRVFYEKDLKYEEDRDFPKCSTSDQESWIELEFECEPAEFDQLKDEYRLPDQRFKVRKYLKSRELDDEKKTRSGIYAYVGGKLSGSRFYGAKNVQQGKLGDIIYIPAATKLDEHTKLTGPSALRDLLNSVLKGVLAKSPSYKTLSEAFALFGSSVKTEEAHPGWSLASLESAISKDLEDWGLQFALDITPLDPEEVVKSLVSHHVIDAVLGANLTSSAFGQGFQRHLIFVLIRLAATYSAPAAPPTKKEFAPSLTWLLFEEPEAFLHPTQIDSLDANLRTYASMTGHQVTISTHNPQFASRSIEELPTLIRLSREGPPTVVSQITASELPRLLTANQSCLDALKAAGIDVAAEDETIEMESIKYALWLNPVRAAAFFAERVLLVEGATEYALLGLLLNRGDIRRPKRGVTIVDTIGKYNTHRFMNLLGSLRVPHVVLFDRDGSTPRSRALELALTAARSPYTLAVEAFDDDLDAFLNVPPCPRPGQKPQHLIYHFHQGHILPERLKALAAKVQILMDA